MHIAYLPPQCPPPRATPPTASWCFPPDYREWIFLTSGIDMAYSEGGQPPMHSMFDNIHVPRDAYRAFLATGTWPDGTVLLMEIRGAATGGLPTAMRAPECCRVALAIPYAVCMPAFAVRAPATYVRHA